MTDFDANLLRQESVTQGATTDEARLAGVRGKGTLQVWRGQKDDVISVVGSWRATSETTRLEDLQRSLQSEEHVTYEGVLDDPTRQDNQQVRTEVVVSSISYYHLGDDGGAPSLFVNFKPKEADEVAK